MSDLPSVPRKYRSAKLILPCGTATWLSFAPQQPESLTHAIANRLSLAAAMDYRFDLEAAVASLAFFDLAEVPAVRPPFPSGVSDVRFRVDLQDLELLDLMATQVALPTDSACILPPP